MGFLERDPTMMKMVGFTPDEIKATVGGAYEAADRHSRELATWVPKSGDADDDILPEKGLIDARTRDTVRNDAYVQSGMQIHKDSIVGSLYALNSKPDYQTLNLDQTWAEEFQDEVERKFTLTAESVNNYLDASRINNFTALVRLATCVGVVSGEILATAEWIKNSPINTAVQMIDPDRLETPYAEFNNPRVRGGVKFNKYGAPQGYFIRRPQEKGYFSTTFDSHKYVPARKPWGRRQVLHIFEQTRPGQSRGLGGLVSALKELRITKKFRDIVLQNAVTNASYAATIESELPTEEIFASMGGNVDQKEFSKVLGGYAASFFDTVGTIAGSANNLKLDGVRIPHLMPGTKLNLHPAGKAGPLGSEFEQSLLRYIAASLDISYEQLSRDYSETNYSSARAAMAETWKSMQAKKTAFADRFATMIFHLWLEEAIATGEITSMPRNAPSYWEGLNAEAYGACSWIGASRGQIDELRETQAAVLRLKYNLSTHEDELGRLGKDVSRTFRQIGREKRLQEKEKIAIEGDNRMMNAVTGSPREKEAKDEKSDSSQETSAQSTITDIDEAALLKQTLSENIDA